MTMTIPQQYIICDTFELDDVPRTITALGCVPKNNVNVPSTSDDYVFQRSFLRELLAFLRDPYGDAFFVCGPTGSGKSTGITEALGRLNWPCQEITAHGRLELADLIGQYKLTKTADDQAPEMIFQYGVLPTAMKHGHVLLINELDYVDPAEIAGLNDIIEGKPLVITENGGEVIKPHPMFRIIATGNSTGNGNNSGLYRGVMAQNIAFMDRFRITQVSYMPAELEMDLLRKKVAQLPTLVREKLVAVANAIRSQFLGESGTGADGTLSLTMSTRTLIRWALLSVQFRQHPAPLNYALSMSLTNRTEEAEKIAIEKIAEGILGDLWIKNSTA